MDSSGCSVTLAWVCEYVCGPVIVDLGWSVVCSDVVVV